MLTLWLWRGYLGLVRNAMVLERKQRKNDRAGCKWILVKKLSFLIETRPLTYLLETYHSRSVMISHLSISIKCTNMYWQVIYHITEPILFQAGSQQRTSVVINSDISMHLTSSSRRCWRWSDVFSTAPGEYVLLSFQQMSRHREVLCWLTLTIPFKICTRATLDSNNG